jgi:hypothetical protein
MPTTYPPHTGPDFTDALEPETPFRLNESLDLDLSLDYIIPDIAADTVFAATHQEHSDELSWLSEFDHLPGKYEDGSLLNSLFPQPHVGSSSDLDSMPIKPNHHETVC